MNSRLQRRIGAILNYITEGMVILVGVLYTPVLLNALGKNEYGLYQISTSVISYLSLLNFGIESSYIRFYSINKVEQGENGIKKINGVYSIVFCIMSLMVLLGGILLSYGMEYVFRNRYSVQELRLLRILLLVMTLNLSIQFCGFIFNAYITANERFIYQKLLGILKGLLSPVITIPLLLLGYGSIAVVAVQTIVTLLNTCVNVGYCIKKLDMKWSFKGLNKTILKDVFIFSFWIFLNQIVNQINWNVDKLILGYFRDNATVAVYSIGGQLNAMYIGFSTAISGVFVSRINALVAEGGNDGELNRLFVQIGRMQFIVLGLIMSGFIVFGDSFIYLWVGNEYHEAYRIALFLMIPATIPLIQNLGISIQRAKNKHRFRSIVYLLVSISNIFVSIPLAKIYGGVGAAMGTAVSMILGNGIIMNLYYHKKLQLDIIYFWKRIIMFAPALVLPAILGYIIRKYSYIKSVKQLIAYIIVYSIIYSLSLYIFGLNKSERAFVRQILYKNRKRTMDGYRQ